MARVWNLSPGPAMLPQAVLARAAAEISMGTAPACR
jgi:phosphoserine aminotransferase